MNILIVTYNWPPRNAIGAHRPYSWAKYWSALGANVTVLTAKKYSFDAPLDLDLPVINGVHVVNVPYLYGKKEKKPTQNHEQINLSSSDSRYLFFKQLRKLKAVITNIFGITLSLIHISEPTRPY